MDRVGNRFLRRQGQGNVSTNSSQLSENLPDQHPGSPVTTNNTNGQEGVEQESPLFCFHTSKLRSWRSNYPRIFCLYREYFTTVDPDSFEVTNTFYYSSFRTNWDDSICVPLPPSVASIGSTKQASQKQINKDEFLFEIELMNVGASGGGGGGGRKKTETLKFKCLERSRLLTELFSLVHIYQKKEAKIQLQHPSSATSMSRRIDYPTFKAKRYHTRKQTFSNSDCYLQIFPCYITEINTDFGYPCVVKRYNYMDIKSACFLKDDPNAIVFYISSNNRNNGERSVDSVENYESMDIELSKDLSMKTRVFVLAAEDNNSIASSHNPTRNQFMQLVKYRFEKMGLEHHISPSLQSISQIDEYTNTRAKHIKSLKTLAKFSVYKLTERHTELPQGVLRNLDIVCSYPHRQSDPNQQEGHSLSLKEQNARRELYLVERDEENKIVSVLNMYHLFSIFRKCGGAMLNINNITNGTALVLEFSSGDSRTYYSSVRSNCDDLALFLMDTCHLYTLNMNVSVADVTSNEYCFVPRSILHSCHMGLLSVHTGKSKKEIREEGKSLLTIFIQDYIQKVEISLLKNLAACAQVCNTCLGSGAAARNGSDINGSTTRQNSNQPSVTIQQTSSLSNQNNQTQVKYSGAKLLRVSAKCIEACKKLNANVSPRQGFFHEFYSDKLPSNISSSSSNLPSDLKLLGNSVSSLLAIIFRMTIFLTESSSHRESLPPEAQLEEEGIVSEVEKTVSTLLQSLYRLTKTRFGFGCLMELKYTRRCFQLLLSQPLLSSSTFSEEQNFCIYWALKVFGILIMSSLPGKQTETINNLQQRTQGQDRNRDQEFVNKQILLQPPTTTTHDMNNKEGKPLIDILVSLFYKSTGASTSPIVWGDGDDNHKNSHQYRNVREQSILISTVLSEIFTSVLCTYFDTTTPEIFDYTIQKLAKNYGCLMEVLFHQTQHSFDHHPSNQESSNFSAVNDALNKGKGGGIMTNSVLIENILLLLNVIFLSSSTTLSLLSPSGDTGGLHIQERIRDSAISSGFLFLHYFYLAIFSPCENQRFTCRFLIQLLMMRNKTNDNNSQQKETAEFGHEDKRVICSRSLLKRILPSGFLPFLDMPTLSEMESRNLDEMEENRFNQSNEESYPNNQDMLLMSGSANSKRMSLRLKMTQTLNPDLCNASSSFRKNHKDDQNIVSKDEQENFRILFHVLTQDHALPDLIWNINTRNELRLALLNELTLLHESSWCPAISEDQKNNTDTGLYQASAWNHHQFRVNYPSLSKEVKVGTVYMRLWLQAGNSFIRHWENPHILFELLFRRLLCDIDRNYNVSVARIKKFFTFTIHLLR